MKKETEILQALKRGDGINKIQKDLNTYYAAVRKIIDKNPGIYKPKGTVNNNNRYSFRVPAKMAEKVNNYIDVYKSNPSKFFNNLLEEWGCGDE